MRLGELLKKLDTVKTPADMDADIRGVCYDSRKLEPDGLFVAVRGFQSDGHDYIGEALAKGAACIVCERLPDAQAQAQGIAQAQYVLVPDSRKALAAVSAAWFGYPAEKLKLVGVTGTNGKTTVSSLLKHVIEICSNEKTGLIGTNGNMIGARKMHTERTTPESYELQELFAEMVREGCRYAVMEVSSHALELSRVHGIEFEAGVFTNLTPEHLEFHASMEDYANAKSLLFKNSRMSAINIDDEYAPVMMKSAAGRVFTFAVNDSAADLVGKSIKLHPDRVDFCALTIGRISRFVLRTPGLFSVYNALAVISAAMLLGFDIECITDTLSQCGGIRGRAEVVPTGRDFTVLIDYAHTPDALENITGSVRGFARGRVVTLFGCGGDRDKHKRPLMGAIAVKNSDFVVVTSDNPRTEAPGAIIGEILAGMGGAETPYRVIENRREAIYWALENALPGDVLILAGKGHEDYQILGREKIHFDEREVVAEYFENVKCV